MPRLHVGVDPAVMGVPSDRDATSGSASRMAATSIASALPRPSCPAAGHPIRQDAVRRRRRDPVGIPIHKALRQSREWSLWERRR